MKERSGRKVKVLYVSELMTGRDSGAKVSTWLHAEMFWEIAEIVDIVCLYPGKDEKRLRKEKFKKYHKTFFIKSYRNKFEEAVNILSLNGWCMNGRIRKRIVTLVDEYSYDCIFLDDSVMGRLTRDLKQKFPHIRIVSYYHDVKAALAVQWMKEHGIKTVPFNLGLIWNERMNQQYADVNLVLNKREGALYRKYYGREAEGFLPVSVPDLLKERDLESKKSENDSCRILFVGAYYYPNVVGIKWFISHVLKKLEVMKYQLVIVGSDMERLADEIEPYPNLEIKGWVEDLANEYLQADIVVEPLFDGGGMKIKTAEALQFGKKIVGTREAFEGYEEYFTVETINRFLYICETPKDFIKAIIQLNKKDSDYVIPEVRDIYLKHFTVSGNKEILERALYGR